MPAFAGHEGKWILGKGDTFYAGSPVCHGVRVRTDSVRLDVFTPRRDDFLQLMKRLIH